MNKNHIIVGTYRNYHYEIYLDVERDCLSGKVREFNGYGSYDSDSISSLKQQLERAIDDDISCKYTTKLAEENNKLRDWTKLHNCEYPFRLGEN